ncbi:hypothetical protein [Gillisia limnaea]|uniref:Uncharacterized protein n=1 Tax=Gillisia limnaea (strain DSM 15749 / LMG 21470 / R-8282) TaxID=865937 RepID=H2BRD1_GILLR|nr:hypothetical protein [Gillisia limnaea]EHQ04450.1 hypothetical protein Gilli_0302 [Gillisia limnaea DSM 15749]
MKNFIFILSILTGLCSFSQVGIGTSNPQAQLDIISDSPSNPSVIDGLLIPRIDKFPTTNPGSNQHAMLIYLTKTVNEYPKGFYFWNNSEIKWETISGTGFGNFFKPGTSSNPNNILDAMYRLGSIGIGTQDITAKLQIVLNSVKDATVKKGLEVDNNNPTVDNLTTYGIISDNRSATNGNKYGFKNNVGGAGTGIHYGIFNETYQNSGTNDIYGMYNRVGKTFGANSNNFGIYSVIGSNEGIGTVIGIYSSAIGSNTAKVFAGYFAGRLGIGLTPAEEYIFPAAKGNPGQILVLDSSGNMNWKYPNVMNYSSTGTATGDYVIAEEVYTLRVNSQVSSITIPDASLNKGRILILISFQGTGNRPFNFLNGDTLEDISTGNNITSISSGNRLMIQSIGTRWIVLFK